MLIVGEKLNSTIPSVREAIKTRNVEFVQDLARRQVAGGASYLDLNTAQGNNELDDMEWAVKVLQEVVDVPLCIDATDPEVIRAGLKLHRGKAMLNSISMETSRLNGMLPLISEFSCAVVGLTLNDSGIPKTAEERIAIAGQLVDELRRAKVNIEEDVYIDPLVLPLAVNSENGVIFFRCLEEIKKVYNVKTISGLSNVSHDLPKRKIINRYFLTACMVNGMDAAIMDPTDCKLTTAITAANLLLGKDRFARGYIKAFRGEALEE
ncbi:methyltetrahydrofolate--corrinoid methyltransferase [Desulfosporosinus youngiae]|uniref:Pterin binding enzyme n=1 Tax=Desulfosporosinus youngiae DSM 17734 TaxID=768710 RepID=H5XUN8_9FIRM|nr:methyltetrahydrofolate--corrinoid methyltransferase [Desulfosporosinus youngiae]EHQ89056.1 Pterin binding enzyme [Desulfosporosinus youngiae DSM 17734]